MQCRNCPYGKENFERRMDWYSQTIEECGIPNDIYGDMLPEDAANEFEQFLWCDKVGGRVYRFGYCSDFYEDADIVNYKNSSREKRRNKRERDLKYKEHLKQLDKISRCRLSPVHYTDEIYVRGYGYIETQKPYYKRLYRSKSSKYFKKQSNKKIRRHKEELHNGWQCHKLYDFWRKYC